jgi:hypothetical protein
MLDGRVPSRDVEDIHRYSTSLNSPIDVGRVPLSLIFSRPNCNKYDIEPMVEGIDPAIYRHTFRNS